MRIGVCLESLGLSLREGFAQASKLGIAGVQFDARGELSPDKLGATARREITTLLRTYNLQLTALNCPFRRGLDIAENQQARIEHVRNVMALAFELGPRIVIVQCPKLPGENEIERANLLRDALTDLAKNGDRIGTVLAVEIGLDDPEATKTYLDTFDVGSLKVNYDPANLLVNGYDPIKGIIPLHRYIAHTHARDARRGNASRIAQEVPVGEGDIDWLSYVGSLAAVEYRGWLTIESNATGNKVPVIAAGVNFLKRMMLN
jgi:L-ribulose-5-phosphate 3-epimerase